MCLPGPSQIFREQLSKLCEAIEADPLRIANKLIANGLIAPNISKNIKSMSGTAYDKADAIVEELQRQLEADSNQVQFLVKISNFLIAQADKPLKDIGNKMMKQIKEWIIQHTYLYIQIEHYT